MKRVVILLGILDLHLVGLLFFTLAPSSLAPAGSAPTDAPVDLAARPAHTSPASMAPPDGSHLSLLSVHDGGVEVEVAPHGHAGAAEVELCRLNGERLARAARPHNGTPRRLWLAADVDPEHPDDYYLRWRVRPDASFQQRSLFVLGEILETVVVGQRAFVAGTRPLMRVLVRDHATGRPVPGATVLAVLTDGDREIGRHLVRVDGTGEAAVPLPLPDRPTAGVRLRVRVDSRTARDRVAATIDVRSGVRTFLVTDRARYQPGHTVHVRGLSLVRPDMTPLADAEVVYEARDAHENTVFRTVTRTDAFGVSHARLVLADELNLGTWTVRAVADGVAQEKDITVGRYVLPTFTVDCRPDRQACEPGDTVRVDVKAAYLFGKPVAEAKAVVRCLRGGDDLIPAVRGTTDAAGCFRCEVDLPRNLVDDADRTGRVPVTFRAAVRDPAGRVEWTDREVTVTVNPIIVTAIPESGRLVPGLENAVHLVATYADGSPAPCTVTCLDWTGRTLRTVKTDPGGFAALHIVPQVGKAEEMILEARDARGRVGTNLVTLGAPDPGLGDRLLVRTDRSVYRVGDRVCVSVRAARQDGPAYLDVIQDHQTCLMRTLSLKDGRATGEFVLGQRMTGTVQVRVYLLEENGGMVTGRRTLLVEPNRNLHVAVETDRDTYRPGEEAEVRLRVTDDENQGVAAALGVMVVDEAAFTHQDVRPGDQKAHFYLAGEATQSATPLGEHDLGGVLSGPAHPPTHRDAAARALLAQTEAMGRYAIHVNTFRRDEKIESFKGKLRNCLKAHAGPVRAALRAYHWQPHAHGDNVIAIRPPRPAPGEEITLADLVELGLLESEQALDPWGHPMKLVCRSERGRHIAGPNTLTSPGIDGVDGTMDDVSVSVWMRIFGGWEGLGSGRGFFGAGGALEDVRFRESFPETLLFEPAVITDPSGRAALTVPLADSITTWRMTCLASSARGALGATTASLRTFQPFFAEVDAPPSLMRGDEISLPVTIHNYLDTPQEVTVHLRPAPWFDLKDEPARTVVLEPSQVTAVRFRIAARQVGRHTVTVVARGTKGDDAVARPVEVVPDGRECAVLRTGRLDGKATHTIAVPKGAIDGTGRLRITIYPSAMSHVVEGLDALLRKPYGCFEQTASVTWPNVLVRRYLARSETASPAIRARADRLIAAGYQRLLSFEAERGGFSLFGKPPADPFLTAYGLMVFHDMRGVHCVDPDLIHRVEFRLRRHLSKRMEETEGPPDRKTLRDAAHVLWALAAGGYRKPPVPDAAAWLARHVDASSDTYTLALAANALAAVDPGGDAAKPLVDVLLARRTETGEAVHWTAGTPTTFHRAGAGADVTATALAVQALSRCDEAAPLVEKAVAWLVERKGASGAWHSTQATVQTLRALLAAEHGTPAREDATVTVSVNGQRVDTLALDAANRDLLHRADAKHVFRAGPNTVTLRTSGKRAPPYQVVARYHVPWDEAPPADDGPLKVRMALARTRLRVGDTVGVTATVTNTGPDAARMGMAALAVPPGFTLVPDALERAVENKEIEKYTPAGRHVVVYLREVPVGGSVTLRYGLLARYPLRVRTPASVAYEYYRPDARGEAPPVRLTVVE